MRGEGGQVGQTGSPNDIQGTKLSRGKKIYSLAFCFVFACRQPLFMD